MEMIKVNVQAGVYLHQCGNFLTVEFGQFEGKFGQFEGKFGQFEGKFVIKTVGINSQDIESIRYVGLDDGKALGLLARVVHQSEYLGEL